MRPRTWWMRMRHWFWERYLNLRYPYRVTDFYTWDSYWDEVGEPEAPEVVVIDEHGEFRCICGNYPNAEGAYPCDREGNEVPPDQNYADLYQCDRCKRVFSATTGEVVKAAAQAVRHGE